MSSALTDNFLYSGSFGKTSKDVASSFVTNRFDQWIMDTEDDHGEFKDDASSRLNQLLKDAPVSMKNLARLDGLNPREAVPADLQQIQQIDKIPNLYPFQINMLQDDDYNVNQRVNLVRQAFSNYLTASEALNPAYNVNWSQENSSDIFGGDPKPKKNLDLYTSDGNAAGQTTNRLDEMGYRLRSVESVVAF